MRKRGTPSPINGALNRSRTKLGLELGTWMVIVFVSITVFLVGFRFTRPCHLPDPSWGGMAYHPQAPQDVPALGSQPSSRRATMTRVNREQARLMPWYAKAGAASSIVPVSRFVSPNIFAHEERRLWLRGIAHRHGRGEPVQSGA